MRTVRFLGSSFLAWACFGAVAQEYFLGSFWQNNIPALSNNVATSSNAPSFYLALWSGGNESSISNAPVDQGGTALLESAIGQITPQSAGYPAAPVDLANAAAYAATHAQTYRYTFNLFGGIAAINPPMTWSIVFPGGFNPTNGTIYGNPPAGPLNYDTNLLNQADYYLRARLLVNPCDTDAAQQLVLLQEERMLPLEWSGGQAIAYATKLRLTQHPSNGSREVVALQQAAGFYRSACDVLSQFLANPSDAALAEGWTPCLSAGATNQVAQVLDDYLRDLAEYARARLAEFQTRSLLNFYDPSQQQEATLPPATQSLLNDIAQSSSDIQTRLLLAAPFQNLPFYTTSLAGEVQNMVALMSRMSESILLGRVLFIAGASGYNADPSLFYGEYTSSFIPFFNSQLTGGGTISSYTVAFNQAQAFINWAAPLEASAAGAVSNATVLGYDYAAAQAALQDQYKSQLLSLCGYSTFDTNGFELPDIFFAGLPPGVRESTATQLLTNYNISTTARQGAIYQQWGALQLAEGNLTAASVQLSNIFATMLTKQQVAQAIYSNYVNLASLILSNGQAIAALDIKKGQIEAAADLAIAQINQDAAESQGGDDIFGTVLSVATTAITAYETDGASLAASFSASGATGGDPLSSLYGNAFSGLGGGYDASASALTIGQVEANTARQLAVIDAKIQQLTSAEQAQMQYVNADNTMLNLSADLNTLRLQAESQEVQVRLAAQNVDQERSKLATLLGQVSYLLRQYGRSASLLAQNPQYATNNLIVSVNATIHQADDAFLLAQQWVFLTAQCFYYEDNCLTDQSARPGLTNVLSARNVGDLQAALNFMQSSNVLGGATCQNSTSSGTLDFSLRNNFFQQNTVSNGIVTYEPVLVSGRLGTNAAASTTDWTNFLAQSITWYTNGQVYARKLTLRFSTTVSPEAVNGLPTNPFFYSFFGRQAFGAVISPYPQGVSKCAGVQVNLVTATNYSASANGMTVLLEQMGTSTLRSFGYCNPNNFLRCFNFDLFQNSFSASFNGFDPNLPGSSAFSNRSIANDQWVLVLDGANGPSVNTLLDHLDWLLDLQVRIGVRFYTDSCQ